MRPLLVIVTCVILISCKGYAQKNRDQQLLLNGTWVAVSINGSEIEIDKVKDGIEPPRLEINVIEMKYTGNDGCNNFMGGITQMDEERIIFGVAAGTRRMCPEMMIPDQFNMTLAQITSYELKKQMLQLISATGDTVMKLTKVH